mmetsp:Transcript_41165/g.73802  ORF Transcript_41165/g.73802 Transcript_41165/m.73802 type:complete len:265 (-) Transcript_41165:190-984(-)
MSGRSSLVDVPSRRRLGLATKRFASWVRITICSSSLQTLVRMRTVDRNFCSRVSLFFCFCCPYFRFSSGLIGASSVNSSDFSRLKKNSFSASILSMMSFILLASTSLCHILPLLARSRLATPNSLALTCLWACSASSKLCTSARLTSSSSRSRRFVASRASIRSGQEAALSGLGGRLGLSVLCLDSVCSMDPTGSWVPRNVGLPPLSALAKLVFLVAGGSAAPVQVGTWLLQSRLAPGAGSTWAVRTLRMLLRFEEASCAICRP